MFTVIAVPPINSSGDIYHVISYIILSKKYGIPIPPIVLSYDTDGSAGKGVDLDTKTQVMRGINFADDLGYGDLFNNPFGTSTPMAQSSKGDLDFQIRALQLDSSGTRQNARQSSLELFLQNQSIGRNCTICYLDQKALTNYISCYFIQQGREKITSILRQGYSQRNNKRLSDPSLKLILEYARYWNSEIEASRNANQPALILNVRHSSNANSGQNMEDFWPKFKDYLERRGYLIWLLFSDGRIKGSYPGMAGNRISPFQEKPIKSRDGKRWEKLNELMTGLQTSKPDYDFGKLKHLELLLCLQKLSFLKGIIGNTSGTLDLAAFLGHNVYNIHHFSFPRLAYQDYRILLQMSFLSLENFDEAMYSNFKNTKSHKSARDIILTDKDIKSILSNFLSWHNESLEIPPSIGVFKEPNYEGAGFWELVSSRVFSPNGASNLKDLPPSPEVKKYIKGKYDYYPKMESGQQEIVAKKLYDEFEKNKGMKTENYPEIINVSKTQNTANNLILKLAQLSSLTESASKSLDTLKHSIPLTLEDREEQKSPEGKSTILLQEKAEENSQLKNLKHIAAKFSAPLKKWQPENNTAKQNGWNCFDIAVGIKRTELIEYALTNAPKIEFRQLLAPELKHAAAVTAVYMSILKRQLLQEQDHVKKREHRILELFQINDALKGEEIEQIEEKLAQLLITTKPSTEAEDVSDLSRFILPEALRTNELFDLVSEYFDAHESEPLKIQANICSNILGYEKSLSIESLDSLFLESSKREQCGSLYDSYIQVRTAHLGTAEQKFKNYFVKESVYISYVQGYYGAQKWFAFQRHFCERSETSMVDIVAHMLKAQIFIHDNSESQKVIYQTKKYDNDEIHIEYNGVNHFVRLVPTEDHNVENIHAQLVDGISIPSSQSENEFKSNLKIAIAKGLDINQLDSKNGRTLLHYAIVHDRQAIANILMSNGVDLAVCSGSGKKAVDYGNEYKREWVANLSPASFQSTIVEEFSRLTIGNAQKKSDQEALAVPVRLTQPFVPLLLFSQRNQNEVRLPLINNTQLVDDVINNRSIQEFEFNLKVAITKGLDINQLDSKNGRALLHYAIVYDRQDIANILMSNGADLAVCSGSDKKAVDYGNEYKREWVEALKIRALKCA